MRNVQKLSKSLNLILPSFLFYLSHYPSAVILDTWQRLHTGVSLPIKVPQNPTLLVFIP